MSDLPAGWRWIHQGTPDEHGYLWRAQRGEVKPSIWWCDAHAVSSRDHERACAEVVQGALDHEAQKEHHNA